jgi:Bacterial Ig-like domain
VPAADAARRLRSLACGRRLWVVAAVACLLLASGAAAAPGDAYTAASTPSHVKPTTSAPYTITLTNLAPLSRGQRATIAIPPGFSVAAGSVQATTQAVGGCDGSAWVVDGQVVSEIVLQRPGNNDTGLCPGATLTVSFTATSAAVEATYTWATQLFVSDTEQFALNGSQPTVIVDGTAPVVAIGDRPGNPTNSRSATFTFSASEPTQCKLDAGATTPCSGSVTYTNLSDGPHTFTVQATDAAGNSAQDSYTWTVETRAPSAAVSSGPAGLSNSRSATFVFSADEPSRFDCQLDAGSFLPCNSPASYQGLGDGAHTFTLRPTDSFGNTGGTTSYAWRIDATAPETRLTSAPRPRTTIVSATFRFAASEAAAFQCRLDTGAFAACVSPKTYTRLRRRAHTFEVRAVDAAGNVDPTPAVRRWTIAALTRTTSGSAALLAPRAGARVRSAPLLVWRQVARASYYNVQLYRGRTKVLSAWPTRARLRLRARWTFLGRQQRLVPGTYRWYVWPRFGRGASGRYGRLLGRSTFTVTAAPR